MDTFAEEARASISEASRREGPGRQHRARANSLESSTEEGGGEGYASSSNEMPRLELKKGKGDGERGFVDDSLFEA